MKNWKPLPYQLAQAQAGARRDPMADNMLARQMLLTTGVPMKRLVGTFGPYALGANPQIQLDRVGVMTAIELEVEAAVTITAAPATANTFGAFNLISNIKYTDFNSVDRVNSSGALLFAHNSVRAGWLYNWAVTGKVAPDMAGVGDVDDVEQYNFPIAVGAAQNIRFNTFVPLAYNPKQDLRGAVLAQTVVGDHYLKIQFCNSATGDASAAPYTTASAGTPAISNIYVRVWEHYIQPQDLRTLPMIDLSTIYGIEGNYLSTDNFAAGGSKFINFPNNRSVLSSLHYFVNNGAGVANSFFDRLILLANANTHLREDTAISLRRAARMGMGGDLPAGVFQFDCRSNPIATTLYGNVQVQANIASGAALTTPYVISQFEDFYPAGVPLPGVATSGN